MVPHTPKRKEGLVSDTREKAFNLPNAITTGRILAALVIWLFPSGHLVVLACATLGVISDALDGWIARRWHLETWIGKRIDQIADLLFGFALAYAVIAQEGLTLYNKPILFGIVFYAAALGLLWLYGKPHESSKAAKWKTAIQFASAVAILAHHTFDFLPLQVVGYAGLYLSMWLSGVALLGYYRRAVWSE